VEKETDMSATVTDRTQLVNGVNVGDVLELVSHVQANPELARSRFRATNKWINGGHNQSRVHGFYAGGEEREHLKEFVVTADEPLVLAGTDKGANPVEYLLSALTACLTTTMVYHAAVRGIEIRSLEAEVEGDIDLRGFLGLSDEVRRGFQNIRVNFKVDTDAENLELLETLSKLSPVFDTTENGTSVAVAVNRM
jgi:uncharacterized OsmC-like protein